jgi:hypothetical protein
MSTSTTVISSSSSTQTQRTSMLNTVMLSSYTPGQIAFINWLQARRTSLTVYDECTMTRADLVEALKDSVYVAVPAWIAVTPNRRAGRGNYLIPEINVDVATLTINTNTRGRRAGSPNVKGRTPVAPAPVAVAPTIIR